MRKILSSKIFKLTIALAFLFVLLASFQACSSFGGHTDVPRLEMLTKQAIYSQGHFQNPKPINKPFPGFWFITRKFMFSSGNQTPSVKLPIIMRQASAFSQRRQKIRITWFGHSSILLEMESKRFLFDPVFSQRASPFQWMGPKRFHPVPVDWRALPELDAIIISHDHYDHLDYETILGLKDKTALFIVPLGVATHLKKWGVAENKIVERDWWQEHKVDGIRFVATPAQHFSGRRFSNRNSTLWASWAVLGQQYRIYFSGDTGMFNGFKEIGQRLGPFDYTLMHIGAYVNQQEAEEFTEVWNYVHMTPEEAVQAHKDVRGKIMLPIHWGTFRLAFHDWNEPPQRMLSAGKQIPTYIPIAGEWIEDTAPPKQKVWWLTL